MKRLLPVLILPAILAAALPPPAGAGIIDPAFQAYLNGVPDQDHVSAIVYLSDQADIRALDNALRNEKATMDVRHERVLAALQQAAERSQPALLSYLESRQRDGSVRGFTPYWIMNLVVVQATKAELERIARRPDVDAIEVNFHAALIESVGLAYTGNPTLGIGITNSLRAINADRVWNELGITGAGTLVANLDTGVDGNHPALNARWRGNSHPWQECWRDALGTGTTFPSDGNGHGTHTMGTICGFGEATNDHVGVAYGAQWIADNSINQSVGSAFDNDVLGAFQWFTDPDGNPNTTDDVPDVLQNSWGIDARFGLGYQDCDYRWQTAIENCEAAGVVVTFSSGNEGPNPQTHRSPANICRTTTTNFAVGAVDAESYSWPYPIASFSSRGPSDCDGVTIKPEVSAPGVNVYSSYPGGTYVRMSGTSMAGPHVAGVVALMRQANPNADVQAIKNALMATARDAGTAGEDNSYGWGVIDAYAAVQAVLGPDTTPPTVTVVAPNGGENLTVGSTFTIRWSASDNVGVTQCVLYYSTNGGGSYSLIATLNGNPGSYAWTVPNTPTAQGLVRVNVFDAAGNSAADASDGFFTISSAPANYVWVQSITLELVTHGSYTNAKATVVVRDQNGNPASGATVSSHWSGLTTDSDVFTTKRNGTGTCNSDRVRWAFGCWDYDIDNVALAGYVYRPELSQTHGTICTGVKSQPAAGPFAVSEHRGSAPDGDREFLLNLPDSRHVTFTIYNVGGQAVRTLVDEVVPSGVRSVRWNQTGENGLPVPSGVYLYRVVAGSEVVKNRVVVVR